MGNTLHITSGDCAGERLAEAGLPGEVLVWRDILYDGPRHPGWPDEDSLDARAAFLSETTAGGLGKEPILETLHSQYRKLAKAATYEGIVLWFDACLFDQSMLAHILTCLRLKAIGSVELLCVDAFPGIEPFNGLGQLQPGQLATLYDSRCPVSDETFRFAEVVDKAFATQDSILFRELSEMAEAPLAWVPAAVARWMQEKPNPGNGLGRLEALALAAIGEGNETPGSIFASVASADAPPQYWGDTTLWTKINGLADRTPPLVQIQGPADRLPQWESELSLADFRIAALPNRDQPIRQTRRARGR
ncbi:hypothetical protein PDESU_02951 [Pontiella desulfatans]|uniref:DUF1835 domain-containing protein n=1 Tax=Pontiella desulfatans TaxID=2750659 RepID=A0A6C2U319_PONDE|nr:DUF1835 domain-containing protein [Pontiella desulfatans]VGO14390.1 hypothetical protein PDESU_02951 [Pontiella desulfatans]